jgi:hypothetical protein
LIKRDQEIGFVARGKNFAGAHADLEDRRAARNRGGDRHVSHDIVIAAAGEAREKRAGALDAVLRITGKTDDGVVDTFRAQIGAVRLRCRSGGWCSRGLVHGINTLTKAETESTDNSAEVEGDNAERRTPNVQRPMSNAEGPGPGFSVSAFQRFL